MTSIPYLAGRSAISVDLDPWHVISSRDLGLGCQSCSKSLPSPSCLGRQSFNDGIEV